MQVAVSLQREANHWVLAGRMKSGVFPAGLSAEFLFLSVLPFQSNVPLSLSARSPPFLPTDFLDFLLAAGESSLLYFLDTVTEFPSGEEAVHVA
ncbi:MAG TPA: hypothetical protein DIV54_02165 [Verrucomicrobiales bacterium]|nr:hypothetical protein [Verrucomicrobiales bacterium]